MVHAVLTENVFGIGARPVKYVRITVAVLLLVAMLIFAVQNIESVKVAFLVWSVDAPQVFVILGTYVLGMVTGWGLVEVLRRLIRRKKES